MDNLKSLLFELSPIVNETETIHTRENPMFQDECISQEDLALIHKLSPIPLKADQVFIRSMFLCSSQPCLSDGCRLLRSALEQIAQLVIGQSVLTGHDRSSLPLARFFKAEVVQRGTEEEREPIFFVRAWFYWLRETSGAKDLLLNIDGGIYREVSLAWKYDSWKCSICGAEQGKCDHRVGDVYYGKRCCRLIDHVTDVLEGSLVYKSADRNTLLSGSRGEYSPAESEPIFFLCSADDPLLKFLESQQVIQEKQLSEEWSPALQAGIRYLWIRAGAEAEWRQRAASWLIPDGICLLETIPPGDTVNFCQTPKIQWVSHRNEELTETVLHPAMEE